ncbi:GntR family transcriptional regulator [Peribacillus sp. NPDC096540]|uniref:GntR family transcriptional regulator n=1 Tax=Peribacillus sp. NPDC096540 TaxID=3390612 RepID=UPI003CFDD2C5
MEKEEFHEKVKENPFAALGGLVYDFLFDNIITMKILPGSRINEVKIAKELGISRSPIRTAIERLVNEQLIVKESGKYPFVALITPYDCLQITQARVFIESNASYLAAQAIDQANLEKLKMLALNFEKIVESIELNGFETCDHEFHSCIVNASGNPYIIEMYNCIQSRVLRYRYYLRHRLGNQTLQTILKGNIKSHRAICYAMEIGLPTMVRDEVARHSDAMRDIFARW